MTKKITYKFLLFIFLTNIIFFNKISVQANESFSSWLESYKKSALENNLNFLKIQIHTLVKELLYPDQVKLKSYTKKIKIYLMK